MPSGDQAVWVLKYNTKHTHAVFMKTLSITLIILKFVKSLQLFSVQLNPNILNEFCWNFQ